MSDSFEDLSARARRGELSRPEQQRLDTFLKASFEARVWHEAGCQLDAEDRVLPGDHAAVERVMRRTVAAFAPPPQRERRRGRWAILLVAAALFGVSAAAASVEGVRWWRARSVDALPVVSQQAGGATPARTGATPAAVVAAPHSAASAPAADVPAVDVPAADVPAAAVPLVSSGEAAAGAVTRSSPPKNVNEEGAAALFSAAALARREGNAGRAVALLDSLQQRFPGSREARASDMTLGSLHLQRGATNAALEHFGRYLRAAPRGELAAEALWGQAQALTALGRRAEAAARLRQLQERFPGSPYAAAARVKLEQAAP